jgi:hypothetical protein
MLPEPFFFFPEPSPNLRDFPPNQVRSGQVWFQVLEFELFTLSYDPGLTILLNISSI